MEWSEGNEPGVRNVIHTGLGKLCNLLNPKRNVLDEKDEEGQQEQERAHVLFQKMPQGEPKQETVDSMNLHKLFNQKSSSDCHRMTLNSPANLPSLSSLDGEDSSSCG